MMANRVADKRVKVLKVFFTGKEMELVLELRELNLKHSRNTDDVNRSIRSRNNRSRIADNKTYCY